MVACISLERLQMVLSTTGLPAADGGHDGACGVEEKPTVMRGMMVVPRAGGDCGERGR